jgi:hypothetical protein
VGFGRGIRSSGILGDDALVERALGGVALHDGGAAFACAEEAFLAVEPELGLAAARVRAVALEAGVGQDGTDVPVEAEVLSGSAAEAGAVTARIARSVMDRIRMWYWPPKVPGSDLL